MSEHGRITQEHWDALRRITIASQKLALDAVKTIGELSDRAHGEGVVVLRKIIKRQGETIAAIEQSSWPAARVSASENLEYMRDALDCFLGLPPGRSPGYFDGERRVEQGMTDLPDSRSARATVSLFTLSEAADLANVPLVTLRRYCRVGRIGQKVGNQWVLTRADIDTALSLSHRPG